jgi:hypothetical protein
VAPPRSDRVSRAPPYSRTPAHPYPYRAVTVCGAPFQTLPVRKQRPLAWSAFARRYLRSRCCCPFLRLLRCFSSPGSPHAAMDSPHDTAKSGGLPHSEIRGSTGARPSPRLFAACHVLHRLSVPRHSPDALIVPRPRPTPSTRRSRVLRTEDRRQRTDQTSRRNPPMGRPRRRSVLCSLCDLFSGAGARTPPLPTLAHRQAHTHAQARPQPSATMPGMMPDLLHGHDSLHDFIRTEDRGQTTDHTVPHTCSPSQLAGPMSEDALRDFLSSVHCPPASAPGGPGPI